MSEMFTNLQLPMIELPPWRIVVPIVTAHAYAACLERLLESLARVDQRLTLVVTHRRRYAARNNHGLQCMTSMVDTGEHRELETRDQNSETDRYTDGSTDS